MRPASRVAVRWSRGVAAGDHRAIDLGRFRPAATKSSAGASVREYEGGNVGAVNRGFESYERYRRVAPIGTETPPSSAHSLSLAHEALERIDRAARSVISGDAPRGEIGPSIVATETTEGRAHSPRDPDDERHNVFHVGHQVCVVPRSGRDLLIWLHNQ